MQSIEFLIVFLHSKVSVARPKLLILDPKLVPITAFCLQTFWNQSHNNDSIGIEIDTSLCRVYLNYSVVEQDEYMRYKKANRKPNCNVEYSSLRAFCIFLLLTSPKSSNGLSHPLLSWPFDSLFCRRLEFSDISITTSEFS